MAYVKGEKAKEGPANRVKAGNTILRQPDAHKDHSVLHNRSYIAASLWSPRSTRQICLKESTFTVNRLSSAAYSGMLACAI